MWRCALAAGTARPAVTKIAAAKTPRRLRNDRLPLDGAEHAAQTLFQFDGGLPPEQDARASDVGLPDLWIVDGERFVDDLALRRRDRQDCLRELVQRELAGVAEVHRQVLARV